MSTEHNGFELEYGPTPPGAKYEHTDIDASIGYKFALWLTVAMFIGFGIVYGTFWLFEGRERAANAAAQPPSAAYVRAVQRRNIAKSKLKGMVESI